MPRPFETGPRPDPEPDPIPQDEPTPQAQPLPCPECDSDQGYTRVGNYRAQCNNCNALLKNEEVGMQLPDKEQK